MFENTMSRRGFVASMGMAGLAAAGMGATAASAATGATAEVPQEWDGEYDVIVCGGGGSGLTAAYSALENGAERVLVLEKSGFCGGTTATAEGAILAAGTPWQAELAGVEGDTADDIYNFWICAGEGLLDESLVRVMADNCADNLAWMADAFGLTFVEVNGVPPVPYMPEEFRANRMHLMASVDDPTKPGGYAWTDGAEKAILAAGGEIKTNCAAAELVMQDGAVVGVKTADGQAFKAERGVCLCMSGIEHNEELARRYNPQQYWELKNHTLAAAPGNTGDGIVMGLAAGADMGRVGGTVSLNAATYSGSHVTDEEIPCIYVNMRGARFVREDAQYAYQMRAAFNEAMKEGGWDGCTWMVMDNKMTCCNAMSPWSDVNAGGPDRLAEDLESGAVIEAQSLEELAEKMGVPAANLVATVERWNADAAQGEDVLFGRQKQLLPLDEAPYYAYKMGVYNVGSIGSLRIDTEARVLDRDGQPIGGLYAGGQNSSGWVGPYYPGSGTSLQGTLNWGRIAGRSASRRA